VHADRSAPGRAVVVGVTDEDVRVVRPVFLLEAVDDVNAPVVCAARAIPGKPRLRVDRATRLRRDEVESPDVRVVDEDTAPEAGPGGPLGRPGHEELAAPPAGLGHAADLHDLAARTDRHVAVRAVVRAGHDLVRREGTDLSQTGDLRAERAHRAADVDDDPHLALAGRDRRLVDEAEEALRLLAPRLVSL